MISRRIFFVAALLFFCSFYAVLIMFLPAQSSRYKYTTDTIKGVNIHDIEVVCPACTMERTKICVSVMIHKHQRERLQPFKITVNGHVFEYQIMHVYSSGDDYPKDNRPGFLVVPDFIDYENFLQKVWSGFSYFRNKGCDFVFKMDDDVFMDWVMFSHFIKKSGPNEWIGEYEPRNLNADTDDPKESKYSGVKFYRYSKRDKYFDFMYGQFYGFGSNLFQCVSNEVDRRINTERGSANQWIELHLEDVSMGLILQECRMRKIRDMKKYFFGEQHNLPELEDLESTSPPIAYIRQLPTRDNDYPLWESI